SPVASVGGWCSWGRSRCCWRGRLDGWRRTISSPRRCRARLAGGLVPVSLVEQKLHPQVARRLAARCVSAARAAAAKNRREPTRWNEARRALLGVGEVEDAAHELQRVRAARALLQVGQQQLLHETLVDIVLLV